MTGERGLIEELIRIVNEREVDAIERAVHPEIEFTSIFFPVQGVYRGPAGIRAYVDELRTSFESYRLEVVSVEPSGDDYLVELHARGRGLGSGVELDTTRAQVWTFSGRLLRRVVSYPTVEEARAALAGDT